MLGNFIQQTQLIGLIPRARNLCCEKLLDGIKSCITVHNLLPTHFGLLTFNTCHWQYLPAPMNLAAESMSLFAVVVVRALLVCKYEINQNQNGEKSYEIY